MDSDSVPTLWNLKLAMNEVVEKARARHPAASLPNPPCVKLGLRARLFGVEERETEEGSDAIGRAAEKAEAGDHAGAISRLSRALDEEPESPYVHCLIGDMYAKLGEEDAAEAFYRETLRLSGFFLAANRNTESALYALGCIHLNRGETGAARRCFRKVFARTQDGLRLKMVERQLRELEERGDDG